MTCPRCGAPAGSGRFCETCGAPLGAAAVAALPRPGKGPGRLGRWTQRIAAAVMLLLVALIVAAALDFNPAALGIAIVAAVVPALVYARIVLTLDRYEQEPRRVIVSAFAWGAVAAVLLAIVIEAVTGGILLFAIGRNAAGVVSGVVGAPLIEETTKGIALLLLLRFFRDEFDDVLDGVIYGALIGLGFAMTENVLYLGQAYLNDGAHALRQLFIARVVLDGFGHAAYTATTGAAVGWARMRHRRGSARFFVPIAGWALAVFQHMLWNGSLYLIGGLRGVNVSLLRVVLVMAPLYILPAVAVLYLIARMSGGRELGIMLEQLAVEVAYGVLTPREFEVLTTNVLRRQANRQARARGGRAARRRQRRFFQVAAELAFRKHHLSQGETLPASQEAPEHAYRAELARLRTELNASPIPPGPGPPASSDIA